MSDTVITAIITSILTLTSTLIVQYVIHRGQTQAAQTQQATAKVNAQSQVVAVQEKAKTDEVNAVLASIEEITRAASSMVTQYHSELLQSRKELSDLHADLATVKEKALQTEGRLHDEIAARRREGDLHHSITQGLNIQLAAAQQEIAALTAKVKALEEENRQLRERRRTGDLNPEHAKKETL